MTGSSLSIDELARRSCYLRYRSYNEALSRLASQYASTPPSIKEQVLAFGYVREVNLTATIDPCKNAVFLLPVSS